MKTIKKTELLAPAGSYEAFEAALGAGADAVYVGGPDFGARAYAKNFTGEELLRAIRTAHIHGRKLYLTVNTLLKNKELTERLYDALLPCYEEGLDAVIVQDFGVLRFIRRTFPDLHIHASTQMAVTGAEGMKFLEELGVTRVVTARELSLGEISAMHRASSLEIESFVHGALCYSVSGQCLMSSILGGRSGNRGRCAQPCRLPYQVKDDRGRTVTREKDLCPLSLKDICTLDILPDIVDAGVFSLKIEGRMKQPEYTAGVTGMYRKYLDILENNREEYHVAEEDRQKLLDIFSRGGSCAGYYRQHNGPSMMAFSNEKKTGNVSVELKKRKEKVYGNLILFPESPAILELTSPARISVSLGEVQYAAGQPMEEARIRRQMEKLGTTEFMWGKLDIQMGDRVFVPVKTLNELRRTAFSLLEKELLDPWKRSQGIPPRYEPQETDTARKQPGDSGEIKFYASCETEEQASALCGNPLLTGLYLPFHVMKVCMEKGIQREKELYLAMPHVARGQAPEEYLRLAGQWLSEGMKGFLVRNLESYGILRARGYQDKCVADASLYIWNNEAAAFWKEEHILRATMPLELNEKELKHLNRRGSELLIYGYLPLMYSAQCVRKNLLRCDGRESFMILKDRYGKEFSSVCVCDPWKTGNTGPGRACYNILYNSLPYGLLKESRQAKKLGVSAFRLSFTTETGEEARKIFDKFSEAYFFDREISGMELTKGHFKRGAE